MTMPRRFGLALFVTVTGLAAPTLGHAEGDFALKDGDRVVFYGDSITDQRLYTTFVETYAVTRFPRRSVNFVHSGWGGDRVGGGGGGPIDTRLERDVIAYKPTVVTVMLGMNDGSYRPFDEKIFDTYAKGYKHLVEKVKGALPRVRLTLIQPSPFDDVTRPPAFEGGYNTVLVRYGESVKELAKEEGAGVADLNTPVVAALKKAAETDPRTAEKIIQDRVHPGAAGQLLMAEALLKAWNAPAIVTAVEIDAKEARAVRAENTQVTDLKAEKGTLSWTQEDGSLPMPIDLQDPVTALAVRSSDIIQALDQQTLKVTNAATSELTLKIDGETLGTFAAEKLAAGINLADLPTPMARQAADVHALTKRRANVHNVRWRDVQVPLQDDKDNLPHLASALEALDSLDADLLKRQRAAARPKPRHYELVPR